MVTRDCFGASPSSWQIFPHTLQVCVVLLKFRERHRYSILQGAMSWPGGASARRVLLRSPAAFLRQCRADRLSQRSSSVSAAAPLRIQQCLERPSASNPCSSFGYSCPVRLFSSALPSRATTVLQNPRVDDDGAEMMIEISDRAAKVGYHSLELCWVKESGG